MAVFCQEIDKDKNDCISMKELEDASNMYEFGFVELLIIWSLRESYDYIASLSNDECPFERKRSELSFYDIEVYMSDIVNDEDINTLLLKIKHLSSGFLPLGIYSINHRYPLQGQIGDCGLIATISSLAYSRPSDIYNMFRQNEDGSIDVNFPSHGIINVAPTIEILYKGATTDFGFGGFWPLVLEASFIKIINNEPLTITELQNTKGKLSRREYEIDYALDGISAEKAISILTGSSTDFWEINMSTTDKTRKKLYEITHYKKVAVAASIPTHYKGPCPTAFEWYLPVLPIDNHYEYWVLPTDSCYKKKLMPLYRDLRINHAFSILFYDSENDTVLLRNPWGQGEPSDPETHTPIDGKNDGIFKMKIDNFVEVFDFIYFEE